MMSDPDSELSAQEQGLAFPRTLAAPDPGEPVKPAAPVNPLLARPADVTAAESNYAAADAAWRPFALKDFKVGSDGIVYEGITTMGEGYDQKAYDDAIKKGYSEAFAKAQAGGDGKPSTSWVKNTAATEAYKALDLAESDLSKAKAFAKAQIGSVRSWADTEPDKTAEATRKFKDFLARAKAASDLEQANLDFQSKKQAYNDDRAVGIQKGLFSSNAPYMTSSNSDVNGLSSIIRGTIPDKLPPDYGLDNVVGLPAYGRGTMLPGGRMPDESGLKNFIGGA
jgi:hypothetical protein